jgi:hypothetical protein
MLTPIALEEAIVASHHPTIPSPRSQSPEGAHFAALEKAFIVRRPHSLIQGRFRLFWFRLPAEAVSAAPASRPSPSELDWNLPRIQNETPRAEWAFMSEYAVLCGTRPEVN